MTKESNTVLEKHRESRNGDKKEGENKGITRRAGGREKKGRRKGEERKEDDKKRKKDESLRGRGGSGSHSCDI